MDRKQFECHPIGRTVRQRAPCRGQSTGRLCGKHLCNGTLSTWMQNQNRGFGNHFTVHFCIVKYWACEQHYWAFFSPDSWILSSSIHKNCRNPTSICNKKTVQICSNQNFHEIRPTPGLFVGLLGGLAPAQVVELSAMMFYGHWMVLFPIKSIQKSTFLGQGKYSTHWWLKAWKISWRSPPPPSAS